MKLAIVTGGSRGIGKAIVKELAKEGYKVAFTYRTNKESALELEKQLSKKGHNVKCFYLEQSERKSVKELVMSIIDHFGSIDVLVNNAAMSQEKHFETITDDDWEKMLKVNLQGPFMLIQETLPFMLKERWGRIINITSIGGQWGGFNQVHYAASKAALINLTHSIAKIYSKYGITSNAVAPGLVETDMSAYELTTEAGKKKVENIPIGRVAKPEEVASVVSFLASEEASCMTGQTINVNGGMLFSFGV